MRHWLASAGDSRDAVRALDAVDALLTVMKSEDLIVVLSAWLMIYLRT